MRIWMLVVVATTCLACGGGTLEQSMGEGNEQAPVDESVDRADGPAPVNRPSQQQQQPTATPQDGEPIESGPEVCADLDVSLEPVTPTVVLLIDQSGSMRAGFGNGMNRLQAAYHALMDQNTGVVRELQSTFRFGLALYTSYDGGPTCPELADVRPALDNYDAIDRVFHDAHPQEDTPTGEAIDGVRRMFDTVPDQGRKIILLATDGLPDTCAVPDPQNGQPESIAAAQDAYDAGIETVVLSVGDEVGREHLEDMANAGSGLAIGGQQQAPYYEANDATELADELRDIITSARSCIFRVQGGAPDPDLVDQGTVTLDGMTLEYGGAHGWEYHQDEQACEGAKQCIEFLGTACEALKDGTEHTVEGEFLCVTETTGDGDDGGDDGGETTDGGDGDGDPGPMACVNPGGSCEYDGDCCSGLCAQGACITQ